jgi:coproporphyrinogen III oxidase-like Fe-S oxidoreductase
MGVQTEDASLLTQLNRAMHGGDLIKRGIDSLRCFELVNLDLMFALPGLSTERFAKTVALACELSPDVITVYDTVYKNRGIATQAKRAPSLAPSPKAYGAQYDLAYAALNTAGYRGRYGSVNFSRKVGRLGTSRYLEGRILDGTDYVGVGLYASSLQGCTWRFGKRAYREWMSLTGLGAEDLYELPIAHVMAKFILLALSYGYLDGKRFERRFSEPLTKRFAPVLAFLVEQNLLREQDGDYDMVPGSFADLPGARALFYPEDALPWLGVNVL